MTEDFEFLNAQKFNKTFSNKKNLQNYNTYSLMKIGMVVMVFGDFYGRVWLEPRQ